MAFLRFKPGRGSGAWQLVESYREGAKVRQRIITHVGPGSAEIDTIKKAILWLRSQLRAAGKTLAEKSTDRRKTRERIESLTKRLAVLEHYK